MRKIISHSVMERDFVFIYIFLDEFKIKIPKRKHAINRLLLLKKNVDMERQKKIIRIKKTKSF